MSLRSFWSVDRNNKNKSSHFADNGIEQDGLPFQDIEPPSFSLGLDDSQQAMPEIFVKDSEPSSDEEEHFGLRIGRRNSARHSTVKPLACEKDKDTSEHDWQNINEQIGEETEFLSPTQSAPNSCLKRLRRGPLPARSEPVKLVDNMLKNCGSSDINKAPSTKRPEYPVTPELISRMIRPAASNAVQSLGAVGSGSHLQGEAAICISDDDIEECSSEDEGVNKHLRTPGVRSTPSLRPLKRPYGFEQSNTDRGRGIQSPFFSVSTSIERPVLSQKTSIGSKEVKFDDRARNMSWDGVPSRETKSTWNEQPSKTYAVVDDVIKELEDGNYEALWNTESLLGNRSKPQRESDFCFMFNKNDRRHSESSREKSPHGKQADVLETEESRIAGLLRKRLPHFIPIDALPSCAEPIFIKYREQFGLQLDTDHRSLLSKQMEEPVENLPRRKARRNYRDSSQVKVKHPTQRKRAERKRQVGSQVYVQAQSFKVSRSGNTHVSPSTGEGGRKGYWVTERSGSRIYVTQDGERLSGTRAYKQYLKVSFNRIANSTH
ncbi:hypothetical protein O6H91_09G081400 [Diphasiastrum complanatum]|uniref:Uncharacterized protein n=1 Tax=Diphasiastrum complanatum TaxID=34168 RepID=A0ACC2CRB7_DIPCM|nr:hypothetical protein O6H91_09G081400 [Diphasiastrum complanatum]